MKTIKSNYQNKQLKIISNLVLTTVFSLFTLQTLAAETVPSFPAPTTVDIEKNPSRLNPFESVTTNEKLNDPKALNAIRTLIQGGIPVGQSKTQIMNNVAPISQYSGAPTSGMGHSMGSAYRYKVKKGDTLNQIIKSTFNQHPLKMKAIGAVIIKNNKNAFPTGKATSMQAGATLIIPSVSEIGMNPTENPNSSPNNVTGRQNPYVSTDPHKGWVRFP